MVRFVPLVLALACIAGGAADTPPLPANASLSAALGIFADPDRIPPETLVPGFVCTVFVPNDAAIAAFLRAAQLTPRQLRDNKTLLDALAREHVVPHVALRRIDFDPEEALTTLSQETLHVRPTAGLYVVVAAHSSAVIRVADVAAGLCVQHVVDSVLIPSTVAVQL